MQSPKLTTIYRGQRLGGFYVESSAQGVGKSRRMAGESAHLAVPEYYDLQKKKWVITNIQENVLYISTELQLNEVQTIWVANISGVEEELAPASIKITGSFLVGSWPDTTGCVLWASPGRSGRR